MILAGGQGKRLYPLTRDRAKPAVPFGGLYRIIDLVLSNFINSGFFRIKLLTQYKSHSLEQHVARGWRMAPITDNFVECLPAQQRLGMSWYKGSADSIYQSLHVVEDEGATDVCIFGADHVYQMDIRQMLAFHHGVDADATVAVVPVPVDQASAFGIVVVDEQMRVLDFQEKPEKPASMPGNPDLALASMGNYIFRTGGLVDALAVDAAKDTAHDFGKDILPRFVGSKLYAYDFASNVVPGGSGHNSGYWRDVGSIDSYFEANMDLISYRPRFDIHNTQWPLRSSMRFLPPAKFVHMDEPKRRVGRAIQSMVSDGCIVSGGLVQTSILGPGVRVNSYASIRDSILFGGVDVGRRVRLKRVIVDKDVAIPAGVRIGYNHDLDRSRGFTVSESGVVVVPKRARIDG
ncbi:MAG: glucose-1-phosphate adenylyltransferase [Deltaproteobacteria bacterium]|nr:glucose-1-phosphate adenylyltransferase [Deltaproteobacteria bacterium]